MRTPFSKLLGELQLPQSQSQADFQSPNSQCAKVFWKALIMCSTNLNGSLWKIECNRGFWSLVSFHGRWSGNGSERMPVQPPAEPEAGPAITSESRSSLLHQGAQPMQHPPKQARPACKERGGNRESSPWSMALYQGCWCDFPSYQPLPTSEVDKLASTVKSQERSPCAWVLLFPDNWITGARN